MEEFAQIIMKKTFNEFGILLGCAANAVPKVETIKKYADILEKLGYNSLYLETADTYKIEGEPYFGYMRGGYTEEEIHDLDLYCRERGIELVPAIQTLAHLHFLKHYERYQAIIDTNDVLLVGEEQTYELIDKMFSSISKMYSSRRINIGMDEAYLLGSGKYLHKNGYKDRIALTLEHLEKVIEIAKKYGFKCEMWSDMFFHAISKGNVYETGENSVPKEWKDLVPKDLTLVYWEYFVRSEEDCGKMIDMHRQLSDNIKFAGTFFRWYGVAPLNAFSNKVMKRALKGCKNRQVKDVIFALWADYSGGASIFSVLPAAYAMSKYAELGCDDSADIYSGFKDLLGIDYKDFALMDSLNYPYTDFETKEVSDFRLNNKSYFYLFNDIFYGTFDSLLSDGIGKAYETVRDELKKIDGKEWQYLFDTLITLADVLTIKAELGKRIRSAYKEGNMEALRSISQEDIPSLLEKLERHISAFECQWLKENKAFGLEVQNLRFGALKERIAYANRLIGALLDGRIDKIEELEVHQEPLGYATTQTEDSYSTNRYVHVVSHGFI